MMLLAQYIRLSSPRRRGSSAAIGLFKKDGFPMKICRQKLKKFLAKANSGMTGSVGGTHAATA